MYGPPTGYANVHVVLECEKASTFETRRLLSPVISSTSPERICASPYTNNGCALGMSVTSSLIVLPCKLSYHAGSDKDV